MIQGIKIEGDQEWKQLLSRLPAKLEDKILRDVARKGGRVIVKEARKSVRIPGELGKHFAREIYVGNDSSNKKGVVVAVRAGRSSKYYTNKKGEQYVPGPIGRHMTEGAKQSTRFTKKKQSRGKVSKRYPDPILAARQRAGSEAAQAMQKETSAIIDKHIKRYRKTL